MVNKSKPFYYITGCDTGFGNLVTKKLDKLGYNVFAGVFLKDTIDALKNECENVIPLQLDITNQESVDNAAQEITKILAENGRDGLDGVVNNAGILISPGPVEWTPVEAYEKMFNVNVLGMVRVNKSVLPLIRRARGRIVNVASIAGRVGLVSEPAYCISKYGVEGYSEVLRRDMLPWDVTVSIIEPGVFSTTGLYDRFQTGLDALWEKLDNRLKDDYGFEYYQFFRKLLGHTLNAFGSTKVELVPNAMIEALTSERPQYRYRVGADSKYGVTILEKLHESTQDAVMTMEDPRLKVVLPAGAPRTSTGKMISAARRYEKNWPRFLFFVAAMLYCMYKMKSKH